MPDAPTTTAVRRTATRNSALGAGVLLLLATIAAPGAPAALAAETPRPAPTQGGAAAQCRASAEKLRASVRMQAPKERPVTALTVVISYPATILTLPTDHGEDQTRGRFGHLPANGILAVAPLDGAVRVVLGKASGLPVGELFTIEFDRCEKSPAPRAEDLRCALEGAAGGSGPVKGVSCTIELQSH